MIDKEKVKELYLKGYSSVLIAEELKCKPETVRNCIERNFKQFKSSHLATKIINKEIDRVTRHEVKQYMSDMTFIKKNRSIYKTNDNGDLFIDKNIAPVVSFDTPRRLKNENSLIEVNNRIIKGEYRKENLLFS